jgi:hypothetical protein
MGAKIVKSKPGISTSAKKSVIVVKKQSSSNFIKSKLSSRQINGSSGFSTKGSFHDENATPSRFAGKKNKIQHNKGAVEKTDLDAVHILSTNNHAYDDFDLIDDCLLKHFFMRSLNKEARSEIIKGMTLGRIDANKHVFQQGNIGNFFYIVKEGELELFINNTLTKSFKKGDSFGELALLHGAPRSGSVKSKTPCMLWILERSNFRKIMEHINQLNYEENINFINSIPILTNLDNDVKTVIASSLIKEYYEEGKHVVRGILLLIL